MKLKSGMRGRNNGLLKLISDLPSNLVMAEIGCYAGESTLMFLQSGRVEKLFAIDTWDTKPAKKIEGNKEFVKRVNSMFTNMKWAEQSFDERTKQFNVVKLKMTFKKAFDLLPPLDFIYIDGDHRYEFVKSDIYLAIKIVKPGGIISGHDYEPKEGGGVIKAVHELLGKPHKIYPDKSWLIWR